MKKTVFTLLLAGAVVVCPSLVMGQEQETVQAGTVQKGVIGDGDLINPGSPVKDLAPEKISLIKEVLGQVYVEVGNIPEPQWFEMEPIAAVYVETLFKARTMSDGKEATRLVSEAWQTFQAAIDAKLTESQKSVRVQKRAEQEIWRQKVEALHPIAIDSARHEFARMDEVNSMNSNAQLNSANSSNKLNSVNSNEVSSAKSGNDLNSNESDENVKSFTIEFK